MRKNLLAPCILAFFAATTSLAYAQDVVVVPDEVDHYVLEQPYDDAVTVQEDIVVGQPLPETVIVRPVPRYDDYGYAVVNQRRVIVEPRTRRIIRVYD